MSGVFAGIDLGGTTLKAVIADAAGNQLAHRAVPSEAHRGPADVLARMAGLVRELWEASGSAALLGVGVGVPGLVDVASGVTEFLPNLPTQWRRVPVAQVLTERLNAPVRLLNDARLATFGELRFGHGKNQPTLTMAFFAIGTGVGGGLAIDGKLWLGPLGAAGELGHQTIMPYGARCGCGNRGCLETIASGTAIAAEGVRLARSGLAPHLFAHVEGNMDRVTAREMFAVSDHDPAVRDALNDAAKAIGIAAANVVTILHPDLIVLGGGVAEMGSLLVETVAQVIRDRVGMFPTDQVRVVRSLLGDQAGLYGAIALAIDAARSGEDSSCFR
jgi:glucokinase